MGEIDRCDIPAACGTAGWQQADQPRLGKISQPASYIGTNAPRRAVQRAKVRDALMTLSKQDILARSLRRESYESIVCARGRSPPFLV